MELAVDTISAGVLLNDDGKTLPLSTLWFQFQESIIFVSGFPIN